MKNRNTMLIEKHQRYQHQHLEKLLNMKITDEEIQLSNQRQIIEQAKFAYLPLGKPCEKQTKTIKDQGEKQIQAIEHRAEKKVFQIQIKNQLLFRFQKIV